MATKENEVRWEKSRRIMKSYGFDGPPVSREELVKSGYSVPADDEPYWDWIERCHSEMRWIGKPIHSIFNKG